MNKLPVPHVSPMTDGLWPGMAIHVKGTVLPKAKRFHVNLAKGPGEGEDIALHLNPRFSKGRTVLNSRQEGRWGYEQSVSLEPFYLGAPFEIVIRVTPNEYRIVVNGSQFADFSHRMPAGVVKNVIVVGDLELHSVSAITP